MKYKITDQHPFCKEGLAFKFITEAVDYGFGIYQIGGSQIILPIGIEDEWIDNEWLKLKQ